MIRETEQLFSENMTKSKITSLFVGYPDFVGYLVKIYRNAIYAKGSNTMTKYLYPRNLRATASLWLWSLRDFAVLAVAALLSVLAIAGIGTLLPAAATICFGLLTIRNEDTTVMDYLKYAVRFFVSGQQFFLWR